MGKKYLDKAQEKIGEVMEEYKEGKLKSGKIRQKSIKPETGCGNRD